MAKPTENPTSPAARTRGGLVAPVALAVALVGTGLAGVALHRSGAPDSAARSTATTAPAPAADAAAAKARACAAFKTVRDAVTRQTHADLGNNPVAVQAVSANARLAMIGGADYLLSLTDPAVPADLTATIHTFTDGLRAIAMNLLAGVGDDDNAQTGRLRDTQAAGDHITELCK
ncbi:MAG: hypothetical protein U0R18_05050 [Mycobacterium sp.]